MCDSQMAAAYFLEGIEMTKTLIFGDRVIPFSTSFAWAFTYKAQFGKDPSKIMMPAIIRAMSLEDNGAIAATLFEELGVICIAQIAWAMAKTCHQTIQDFQAWVISLGDDFSPIEIVEELIPEIINSFMTSKNSPTPSQKDVKQLEAAVKTQETE